MTQNYGKDKQNASKTEASDKAKTNQINPDQRKSEQVRSPDRASDGQNATRKEGNGAQDQGGKKVGADQR